MSKILNTNGLNPILPPDIYVPDGEPKVFDGRVYLYGSSDVFDGGYCSYSYNVYSADINDLTKWTDHGVSFSSRGKDGKKADVPWSDALLWAPDVIRKGDTYYLYFCLSDGTEGVAESKTPYGHFTNARQIMLNGECVTGIDPSVLCDNGKIYYTWGQMEMKMGELEDDMRTIKPETVKTAVITNHCGAQGFHEGSSLRKIGDKYCIVYASEWSPIYPNCGFAPTKLDYAVSDNPYGQYKRKGTIINNIGIDPQSWNNHGSIIKIKDDWFVFYHASSNNTKYSRRARVERLTVDEKNGIIQEAQISTKGFLETVYPEQILSLANACQFVHGAYVTEREDGTHPMINICTGSGASFGKVKFNGGRYSFKVDYNAFSEAKITLYFGDKVISEISINPTENSVLAEFDSPDGEDYLGMEISGAAGKTLCEIINIKFEKIKGVNRSNKAHI